MKGLINMNKEEIVSYVKTRIIELSNCIENIEYKLEEFDYSDPDDRQKLLDDLDDAEARYKEMLLLQSKFN